MKTKLLLIVALLPASPLLAETFSVSGNPNNPTVISLDGPDKPDYAGPSRFTNPRLRNLFAGAGATIDPGLAAELDAKINAQGKMHSSHGKTYFKSGEFSGKSLAQAVNLITVQYKSAPATSYRSGLDKGGQNAAFFEEQKEQRTGVAPRSQPQAAPAVMSEIDARAESTRRAIELYPDAADKDSALNAKIREISQKLQSTNDPILQSSGAPLYLTRKAARELGIVAKKP